MFVSSDKQKRTPGQVLKDVLLELAPEDRPKMLQSLERRAKETSDLEFLRAIKQYREMSREIRPKPDPTT